MQKSITLKLKPAEAASIATVVQYIAASEQVAQSIVTGYYIEKKSVDARGKQPWVHLTVRAFINEPFQARPVPDFHFPDVHQSSRRVLIVGTGPAGLFAALSLLEAGIKPILLERGKDVRARRRDLAALNKAGEVNPESNYCFGEGGAGTYSDGKLYTRSNKRGNINRILGLFVHFGADEKILYQSHPHIGTNKLPHIITAMREQVLACGGEVHFEKKVTGLLTLGEKITGVELAGGETINGDAVILATGHSARDIFQLLHRQQFLIESKPFALGVRVEHPQELIDSCQYHLPFTAHRDAALPPAAYSWVQQVDGKGVFSFCMCPGGIIAPAATAPGELVVNGWSPSKRNNPFANSGIVVTVEQRDAWQYFKKNKQQYRPANEQDPLLLMEFQRCIEVKAFEKGGGKLVAPAQRLVDFTREKFSASLPVSSYLPGICSTLLSDVLPSFVDKSLRQAFIDYGKKMPAYYSNDGIVVATESRTSSPVRIPRHPVTLAHPQAANLYPCGEGAGYAGGIVSAAMDGERVAAAICVQYGLPTV